MSMDGEIRNSAWSRLGIWLILGLCGIGVLGGCKSWAQAGEHTVTIDAPASVNRGEKFTFMVHVKDSSGTVQPGLAYQWQVQWEGVEGILHKGKSGVEQKINVKGSPGEAILHVFGYDAEGNVAELGKRSFKIE